METVYKCTSINTVTHSSQPPTLVKWVKCGNITILAGLSFVAPWAQAGAVSDTNPSMSAWWITHCIQIKHKRQGDATGWVRSSQTPTSQKTQHGHTERSPEQWGWLIKHGHSCIHTLSHTRNREEWGFRNGVQLPGCATLFYSTPSGQRRNDTDPWQRRNRTTTTTKKKWSVMDVYYKGLHGIW